MVSKNIYKTEFFFCTKSFAWTIFGWDFIQFDIAFYALLVYSCILLNHDLGVRLLAFELIFIKQNIHTGNGKIVMGQLLNYSSVVLFFFPKRYLIYLKRGYLPAFSLIRSIRIVSKEKYWLNTVRIQYVEKELVSSFNKQCHR